MLIGRLLKSCKLKLIAGFVTFFPIRVRKRLQLDFGNSKQSIATFVAYQDYFLKFQHRILFRMLSEKCKKVSIQLPNRNYFITNQNSAKNRMLKKSNLTYSERLLVIAERFDENPIIQRGALDTYRRHCNINSILASEPLNEDFMDKLVIKSKDAVEKAEQSTIGFVPDISYIWLTSFIATMLKAEKRVLALNPNWPLSQVRFNGDTLTNDLFISDFLSIAQNPKYKSILEKSTKWWQTRREHHANQLLAGRSPMYSSLDQKERVPKKILFLHCMRDAMNSVVPQSNLNDSNLPLDYIEWTRKALEVVRESPDEWIIKVHIHENLYEGDFEITRELLRAYAPTPIVDSNSPPDSYIFSNDIIFTHSGTVAIECAASGKRAFALPGRLTDSIAEVANTWDKYQEFMRRPIESFSLVPTTDQISAAQLALFFQSSRFMSAFKGVFNQSDLLNGEKYRYLNKIMFLTQNIFIESNGWSHIANHPSFLGRRENHALEVADWINTLAL